MRMPSLHETFKSRAANPPFHCMFSCNLAKAKTTLMVASIYRVAQKVVHFSTHHIFGTVEDEMDFTKMFLEYLTTKITLQF